MIILIGLFLAIGAPDDALLQQAIGVLIVLLGSIQEMEETV